MPFSQTLLPEFDEEMKNTRKILECVPDGKFDFKQDVATNRAGLLAMFDKNVAAAREKIAAASDQDWQVTWTLKFDGNVIFSMPRSTVMRSSIMNHLVHHRAQLGVYLRLNDIAIPGMYGPSADEMNMFRAASS